MPKCRVERHSVTQPSDQSYRLIPLTHGQNAIVDAADFEWLSQWNWLADWGETSRSYYARRSGSSGGTRMHRLLCPGFKIVDHRNRNTLDNRRENLRDGTSGNAQNTDLRKDNTSGYKGASFFKPQQKWLASIFYDGKARHLGLYLTKEEAARAYDAAARKFHGEFAYQNFPHQ